MHLNGVVLPNVRLTSLNYSALQYVLKNIDFVVLQITLNRNIICH